MEFGLLNKVAIVTGGADGIGLSISEVLAQEGVHVVLADINEKKAEESSNTLINKGYSATPSYVDVKDNQSVVEMVESVVEKYGRIDLLINNAGIGVFKSLEEETLQDWNNTLDINLTGTHLCSRAVFEQMKKQQYGKIIIIGSLGGQIGGLKVSPGYVASKAGVIGLVKSYARNGAKYGITANAVAPGPTITEMGKQGNYSPEMTLLGRLGEPLDIAKTVLFLSSSLSDYLTGATLDVNGGAALR